MPNRLTDPIPAIVKSAEDLATLAALANKEVAAGDMSQEDAIHHYWAAGLTLLKAKKKCGHGKWLAWCKENIKSSKSSVARYMNLARKFPTVGHFDAMLAEWNASKGNTEADTEPLPEQSEAEANVEPKSKPEQPEQTEPEPEQREGRAPPDPRYTPRRRTPEQQQQFVEDLGQRVFGKSFNTETAKATPDQPKEPPKPPAEPDVEQKAAEPQGEKKGVGIIQARVAVSHLCKIPKTDPFRKRAFQIVRDWLDSNDV
jgi:hypothetical protein